jgi:hypothetical protein
MKDALLEELLPQVRKNCLISDARYWGYYSVCGLLMRLRELYMFERDIPPGSEVDRQEISEWIGRREEQWEELQEQELSSLTLTGNEYGPFEAKTINALLLPHGLFYGAGYGVYMKPSFFLADLEAVEPLEGLMLYVTSTEHVRDLSISPAMLQERTVIARRHAAEVLISEKFEEYRATKRGGALDVAFSAYGITRDSAPEELRDVASEELRSFIFHELGEAHESERTGYVWVELLSSVAHRRVATFLRGLKDVLADTSERGMLRHISREKKAGSLAFYVALLHGFRKILAEPVGRAFTAFTRGGSWKDVEEARVACYRRASAMAKEFIGLFKAGAKEDALVAEAERHISRLRSPSP